MNALFQYVLVLADDALILAQRLSEWAYKAPFLEEDIALSNISLDLFGRAALFLEYAALVKDDDSDADDLAFKRHEREYVNHLLCEQPNGHFGDTIIRQFLFDSFYDLFLVELSKSNDKQLAAIASKSIKEVSYHLRHSSKWVIRLGDGTSESNKKIQESINKFWMYSDEFFIMNEIDKNMEKMKVGVNREALKSVWLKNIKKVFKEAKLEIPNETNMIVGGKQGLHTEHLGHLLSEMQYLQRAFPDAKW
ncbi:MAG: 1,2-phenylacetyl-CoA epoxidase subunit PaaC [Candidatus Neomarinimicrobiota bacterium]|nr:1,2-phenylacetyl-CoA epoxidase subunit PaaC [Candidatus Neomarinimicrobiota bacterium]